MRRIAIVGTAYDVSADAGGRSDAELLAPVVDRALAASGLAANRVGVVCSASSEFVNGIIGSMMETFDVLPCWPPVTHSHLDGDGAFALYEAWVRLLSGEADVALVCAYGRPSATDPLSILTQQLDPYVVAPFAPGAHHVAALQARALLASGRFSERDLAAVDATRRRGLNADEALDQPYVASPLRAADCSTTCTGAAAIVLAADDVAADAVRRPAWISGIDQRVETSALGARDLTRSVSTELAATHLGIRGGALDLLELHTPYSHQELILSRAIGASAVGALNPSGGVLTGDALMVSGLSRVAAAADSILNGDARRAVGHATNGPCLQHNLLCLLENDA